jgi:hypothetical protein
MSGALGMFHVSWSQRADTVSDWVIESVQEIVNKMDEEKCGSSPIPMST